MFDRIDNLGVIHFRKNTLHHVKHYSTLDLKIYIMTLYIYPEKQILTYYLSLYFSS